MIRTRFLFLLNGEIKNTKSVVKAIKFPF